MSSSKCKSIVTFRLSIPIGVLEIESCPKGLHKLHFKEVFRQDQHIELFNKSSKIVKESKDFDSVKILDKATETKSADECLSYFSHYFMYCSKTETPEFYNDEFNLPSVCWAGVCKQNSFTEKVLKALYNKVEIGARISYKSLASLVGNENAQRAVGTIMKRNPIALIIPCHRVVKTDVSTIGFYNGGTDIKEWLLNYEKNFI